MWWLNVFFLLNGLWVPGHEVAGWAARPHATEEDCNKRKTFAETECCGDPRSPVAVWICSPGQPLSEVPASLRGRHAEGPPNGRAYAGLSG